FLVDKNGLASVGADPTTILGAATKEYVDTVSTNLTTNYLRKDGTVALTGTWGAGNQAINNISTLSVGTATAPTGGVATFNGNVGIGTTIPGSLLDVGLAGTTLGTMRLEGNTSGYVQIQSSAAAGTWTLTLPPNAGSSGYVLQTDGAGNTSWVTAGAATSATNLTGGAAGEMPYQS